VLFSALAWFLVARTLLARVTKRALVKSVRPFLLGFITVIAAPVIFIVLAVSIIGSLVGIAGLLLYVVFAIAALVGMCAVLGVFIFTHVSKKISLNAEVTPYSLMAGALAVVLLAAIPFLGPLVLLGAFLVTLGALIDLILRPNLD
jgi:hypothetical protein